MSPVLLRALLLGAVALAPVAQARVPVFALKQGAMQCRDAQQLQLHSAGAGRIDLRWHGRDYLLTQQPSAAGAWHFEDPASGLVLVQIPAKTMLLDHRRMTRLADECTPRPLLGTR